jgi:N-acetylneuraminic acid mutarotase
MRIPRLPVTFLLLGMALAASEIRFNPLPAPTTNNAVAGFRTHTQALIFSFMGMGAKKNGDAIGAASYSLDLSTGSWSTIRPVPGTVGRIAALAASARDHVFVFGGYVVDERGAAMSIPDVNIYEPFRDRWLRGADIPVPVGDAVGGDYEDRYIYLVGGRSNNGVVSDVQVYDAEKDRWSRATPIPGTPVFGHAGAVLEDTIVYVGGAAQNPAGSGPRYVSSDECWMGKINHHDRNKIEWTKLPPHPGTATFRIAAGGSERDKKIYFSGGTGNPYDFIGVGYDGKPAEPSAVTFAFDLRSRKWETLNNNTPDPTMDHRGLIPTSEGLVIVGGMEKGQQVTARVSILPTSAKAK